MATFGENHNRNKLAEVLLQEKSLRDAADEVEVAYASLKEELEAKYNVVVLDGAITCAEELLRTPLFAAFSENVNDKLRHLLAEACELTLSRIHENMDLKELDHIHYKLHQFLVEKAELSKEKDESRKAWLLRVGQELCGAELNLYLFVSRLWNPSSDIREFIQKLETSCHALYLALVTEELCEISNRLTEFLYLLVGFLQPIRHKFFQVMAVDCSQVEEAVSQFTKVPIPRLPTNLVNKSPKIIRKQLNEMVLDQDHVVNDVIDSLETLNSEEYWKPALRRAFLFLGPTGVGKTQLAKAIALHCYGDLDRLVRVNLSELTESNLWEFAYDVATGPYGVILFEKIEVADPVVLENIVDILAPVSLSKTIIMTSRVGSEKLGFVPGSSQRVVDEARKFFKPELIDFLDGVYVFRKLHSHISVARLLIREWAGSFKDRRILVYLSADIANLLMKLRMRNGHEIKKWLAENVFPKVSEKVTNCKSDETCAVYVDTLVGLDELSFRLESSLGSLIEDWYFAQTKRSLRNLMAVYRSEREVINLTFRLKDICSDLKDKLITSSKIDGADVLFSSLKDLLLSYQNSLASMSQNPEGGGSRFRSELLDRMDDILFLPLSQEPRNFISLSKRMDCRTKMFGFGLLARCIFRGFERSDDQVAQLRKSVEGSCAKMSKVYKSIGNQS